jgi:ABC-type taurine transport system substrate-binding protein
MPNKDDTSQIINEFLQLWQKQFSYIAKDPNTVANMLSMLAQAQNVYSNNMKRGSDDKPDTSADLSGNADDELCNLKQRVEYLEARVAELESALAGAGEKSASENSSARQPGTGERAA